MEVFGNDEHHAFVIEHEAGSDAGALLLAVALAEAFGLPAE